MKLEQAIFAKVFLIVFACIFIQVAYSGLITPPSEGDSLDYHIPLAAAYFTGDIFLPENTTAVTHTKYYPANSEAILSILMLGNIPLGLFNVIAIAVLFTICIRLGLVFKLSIDTSIIFAVTVCTLNIILRWSNTQIIDIWLLNFFLLTLIFLEKPKKTSKYILKLGIASGLLIGTKFSAPFIFIVLMVVYTRRILPYFNFDRSIVFLIPFVVLGVFWYFRNIVLTGNPLYPQAFLFFEGGKSAILNTTVLKVFSSSLYGLVGTLNGYLSEFLAWAVLIPATIVAFYKKSNKSKLGLPVRLVFLSLLLCVFLVNLPSANQEHIMTSSFRYFLPAIIPLILFVFIYFEKIGKVELLSVISLSSLLLVEYPLGYFPKLFFLTIPLGIYIYSSGYDRIARFYMKRSD